MPGPWLTTAEACAYARVSRKTLTHALQDGDLAGYQRKPGGRWRIHRDALDDWLTGKTARPNLRPA